MTCLRLKNLAPNSAHGQYVIGGRQRQLFLLDQQPGNGRCIAQVDRQFEVRRLEKRVLAGKAANTAGKLRIEGQVLIPEHLVGRFADAIQAMTLRRIQRAAQRRLASGSSE